MKKTLFTLSFLACTFFVAAQEETKDEGPKDGWTRAGNISFLFNQSAFNAEWLGGGTSNIAGNFSLSYDFNYRKGSLAWDNKILADYGLTKLKDQEFLRKTNDRFEFNSLVGKQIKESNWYYSFVLNFRTQFAPGYEFGQEDIIDTNTGNVIGQRETRTEITHIFSPAYLQTGPGLLWKKSDNLKVNIAPATARFVFVDGDFTDPNNPENRLDANNAYFGVDANESFRFEFGAFVNAYAKFDIMKNVSMENILNLYSNYLEDPQNVDIDYTANVVMTINKYLSANIAFQAIYDDNAIGAFQIREVFGLGVNYGF
ncbi:DUF3078 domain-containing protein [Aquimarina sp. MMG016]|uniref:DUF3078 domain-containing protein n=1 Tax=Aquimarina sp. MMG016 TaxID=2822690 RepID=UPI001B3A634C|nr:DUF3078 domain-containing protein [Aquimarina sp. MMG016]MBQ4820011.1 DUF3078 domain-containing protein [Aquimarina sp. MMG016]